MNITVSRALRATLSFLCLITFYGCGSIEGDFVSDPGPAVTANSNSTVSNQQILARITAAAQVPDPATSDFTRMPFHGFKAITADGRYVLFVAKGTNGKLQLYRRDLQAPGATVLVSQSTASVEGDGDTTYGAISNDGNIIVFASDSTNLDAEGNPGNFQQVLIRNVMAGTTAYAATDAPGSAGLGANDDPGEFAGDSIRPSISGDGSKVVFESRNTAITGDTTLVELTAAVTADPSANPPVVAANAVKHARAHIVVVDVMTGGATTVSKMGANNADGDSQNPDISRDGRYVVFNSLAENLGADGAVRQIFRTDLNAMPATDPMLISKSGTANGDQQSFNPTINSDGSVVAYETLAGNLDGGTAGTSKILVWDNSGATPTTKLISQGTAFLASLSDDGNFVGFLSNSLMSGNDTLGATTVEPKGDFRTFVHRRDSSLTSVVSRVPAATQGMFNVGNGPDVLDAAATLKALNSEVGGSEGDTAVSGDGTKIAYTSFSTNLTTPAPTKQHVYVSDNPLLGGALAFSEQPGNLTSGSNFAPDVKVEVRHDTGEIDTTFTGPVTLAVTSTLNAALNGTLTVNAVAGVATFPMVGVTGVNETGLTLVASAAGSGFLNGTSTAFEVGMNPPVATTLGFGTQPGTTPENVRFNLAPTVQVLDQRGNPMAADNSTIDIALIQPTPPPVNTGNLMGMLSRMTTMGTATFDDLTVDQRNAGYTFQATVTAGATGLAAVTSNTFEISRRPSETIYVGDGTNNTLSHRFVSTTTNNFVLPADPQRPNVALGNPASGLVIDTNNSRLFVATAGTAGNDEIRVINGNDGSLIDTETIGASNNPANQYSLVFQQGGNGTLYLTDRDNNQLRKYDIDGAGNLTEVNPATGMGPAMPLALDGGLPLDITLDTSAIPFRLLIANNDNTVSVYNLTFPTVTQGAGSPFTVPAAANRQISRILAVQEGFAYITSPGSNELLSYGLMGAFTQLAPFSTAVPNGPNPIISFRNSMLYVGTGSGVHTLQYNGGTGALTDRGAVNSTDGAVRALDLARVDEGALPLLPGGGEVILAATTTGITGFVLNPTTRIPVAVGLLFPGTNANANTTYTNPVVLGSSRRN